MYCTNCGSQLKEGASFCHVCGRSVKTANPAEKLKQDLTEPNKEDQNLNVLFAQYECGPITRTLVEAIILIPVAFFLLYFGFNYPVEQKITAYGSISITQPNWIIIFPGILFLLLLCLLIYRYIQLKQTTLILTETGISGYKKPSSFLSAVLGVYQKCFISCQEIRSFSVSDSKCIKLRLKNNKTFVILSSNSAYAVQRMKEFYS